MVAVKTTLEIPDGLFRKAKATAAERGQSLRAFVTEASQEKLFPRAERGGPTRPRFMRGFGTLRALRKETRRIQDRIDREFEVVEPEDRE